jgi:hypothetical protein
MLCDTKNKDKLQTILQAWQKQKYCGTYKHQFVVRNVANIVAGSKKLISDEMKNK